MRQECGTPEEHPKLIGRYRIERVLDGGGFGLVYLAHDEQLNRRVAMKVPHAKLISKPEDAEAHLAEARTVANLDHPGIVPVFDVGSTEICRCYVVSKYIEGVDLSAKLKQHRLKYREAAELVATVAEALHYAHKQGLVHRDVKPGNIMIAKDGKPYVVDFGLALREENFGKGPKYAGTPAYMSPEQARGEGHRVDGRSDLFSLGVVFYELLAGRQPFRGDTPTELLEQVTSCEARPLRQFDEKLPKELERICHKAIAKRASERYSSAHDMAEDLRHFLAEQTVIQSGSMPVGITLVASETKASAAASTSPGSSASSSASVGTRASENQPIRIVPKGLRSFDAHDADFFLELLPGPRDRHGLPDSLRFWKTRIEETDPDGTFKAGLIYGPTGCGKSSLVKAGLLPRLSEDVIAVYIEATPEETETRLLQGLRKRCPALEDNLSLKRTMVDLRRGQGISHGKKVLIVLDQFEQWLHAKTEMEKTELVQALRQCDGGRVQCIVMVRDDFWLAATRFMGALEVELIQGQNTALADLFDFDHARKVLTAFGRAFGKLPEKIGDITNEQQDFLKQSVASLAEDGKVICVRLALFAEMMKGKSWTPAVLKQVGGTTGVCVTFLEETFITPTAHPGHRLHQNAARAVLQALLPDTGTNIKGEMKSHAELQKASGYSSRQKHFDDLIRILDTEIRLITPTDPDGHEQGEGQEIGPQGSSLPYYQLAHDYLVPSLRDWLTSKQRETRKGRAELKLGERSAIWHAKRESKQLPTVIEWLSIRTLTDSRRWTDTQRAMMQNAARVHGILWGGLLLTVLLLGTGFQLWASAERETNLRQQTQTTVEAMQNNLGPSVPFNLEKLRALPVRLVLPELQTRFTSALNAYQKLSLAFALAGYGELDAEYLASRIDDIARADSRNYVTALQTNRTKAVTALNAEAFKCTEKPLWRRRTQLAIAACALGDPELALDVCTFENRPDPEQRTFFIDALPKWDIDLKAVLDAVKNSESPALRSGICLAVGQIPVEKIIDADKDSWKMVASQWFAEQNDSSTHSAAGWLLHQWKLPLPEIPSPHEVIPQRDWYVVRTSGTTMLRIRSVPADYSAVPNPIDKYRRQLTELQGVDTAELEKPESREYRGVACFYTGQLEKALVDFQSLTKDAAAERQPTILRYLTLTLARLGRVDEAKASLEKYLQLDKTVVPAANRLYMQIQVPVWLGESAEGLRHLESSMQSPHADQDLLYNAACAAALCAQATIKRDSGQSQQFRNQTLDLLQKLADQRYRDVEQLSQDPDLAILHGDARFASFLSGLKTPREFWVGDREVTRGQFEAFMNDATCAAGEKPQSWEGVVAHMSPTSDHPAQQLNWYDAVLYCNWLSRREGLKPCYERTGTREKGHYDETIEHDAWRPIPGSTGYRLLRDAEWEYACRAGTSSVFSSGDDESLLVGYCRMYPSKLTSVCGKTLPNAWGLHDAHGNVWEWCWDNPDEKTTVTNRFLCGGSFLDISTSAPSAYRNFSPAAVRSYIYGFRIARTLLPVP